MQNGILKYLTEKMIEQEERNRNMPVGGKRMYIPLEDRQPQAIFYPARTADAPLVISIHGGGFMLGGSALDNDVYQVIQKTAELNLISLEYRKGPEHPFPHALNDVYEEIQWIMEHSDQYRFDPKRVLLMGIGAGALLALSSAILARRRRDMKVRGLLLFEPLLLLHCYDSDAKNYGEVKEYIHLQDADQETRITEEIIGAEWVKASGINAEMLRDPLFMPLLAPKEDIDPSLRLSFVFSSNEHYMKWLQPLIRKAQADGAYVEWITAPAKDVSGTTIDWSFLTDAISRLV